MMMLWHITIWFMALVQFFFQFYFQRYPKDEGTAKHFGPLHRFAIFYRFKPTLTMWPTQRAFSSGFALYLCGQLQLQLLQFASSPVGHLAWPRPIGQCQAAACHPAILNASQLVNLRSAHLECLLAHSNCRRQYLIEFSTKDVPKLKSLPKTKTILVLIWNFVKILNLILIFG